MLTRRKHSYSTAQLVVDKPCCFVLRTLKGWAGAQALYVIVTVS